MRHLIIGNGIAGVSAAQTLRILDPCSEITIISDEAHPIYSRCLIPHLIDGTKKATELGIRPVDYYTKLNLNIYLGCSVSKLDPVNKSVTLDNQLSLAYDRLLLATGATPTLPDIEGKDLPGVTGLRTIADAERIAHLAELVQQAVVIGGGLVSLKGAVALQVRGVKVTVVIASGQILSQMCDPTSAAIIQQGLEASGINFLFGCEVGNISQRGPNNLVVTLDNGQIIETGLVLVGKGVIPNIQLARGAGLNCSWGIQVDDYLQTSHQDIYAAGDVAETRDAVLGTYRVNALWPNAAEQGRIAAYNMAGKPRQYNGSISMNSVTLGGISVITAGITNPRGSEFTVETDYHPGKQTYTKLVTKDQQLVGMITVGDISRAGMLVSQIKYQI